MNGLGHWLITQRFLRVVNLAPAGIYPGGTFKFARFHTIVWLLNRVAQLNPGCTFYMEEDVEVVMSMEALAGNVVGDLSPKV